jgi:hypothetical protein
MVNAPAVMLVMAQSSNLSNVTIVADAIGDANRNSRLENDSGRRDLDGARVPEKPIVRVYQQSIHGCPPERDPRRGEGQVR